MHHTAFLRFQVFEIIAGNGNMGMGSNGNRDVGKNVNGNEVVDWKWVWDGNGNYSAGMGRNGSNNYYFRTPLYCQVSVQPERCCC